MSLDDPILRTTGLTKTFGSMTAVDDVDVAVREGEVRSIIGPNGAGKTTFFDLVSGLNEPTSGRIEYDGRDITDVDPAERVQAGLARSFQITNIFGRLTVRENLRIAVQRAYVDDLSLYERYLAPAEEIPAVHERTTELLNALGLAAEVDAVASTLSHGNRRRLELGIAVAADPAVLLLDEPMAGVGESEKQGIVTLVEEFLADKTILLVEHDVGLVMDISDRITVLHQGRAIAEGSPDAIHDDEAVREAYLGEL